jgi:hypothetical protein
MNETVKTRMSAAEFEVLPESNLPTELIEGMLVQRDAPSIPHQRIMLRLMTLLNKLILKGHFSGVPMNFS